MKGILAVISLTICVCLEAHADTTYKSADEYVANRIKNLKRYDCSASPYPSYRGCNTDGPSKTGITRVFGLLSSANDQTGFIFVLEPDANGLLHVAEESRQYKVSVNGIFGVEELQADANDRFHIQFTFGSYSMPSSAIYRFKLIEGQWRVAGLDYRGTTRCDDGSIDIGYNYSENFLTGRVLTNEIKSCKSVGVKEYRRTFPKFLLLDFVPLDDKYMP